jgi:hypothetical protein
MPAQEEDMDENSLYGLRRDPPEEFAQQLLKTLHEQPEGPRYGGKLVAALAATAALVTVFAVPSVRAAAMAFLDMFRVVNFAAVPVDEQAMQRLVGKQYGVTQLLGDQFQVTHEPGPPTSYANATEAGAAAGIHVQLPTWMPVGWSIDQAAFKVQDAQAARITVDTTKLEQVLTSLEIRDISIPPGLNGKTATVEVHPTVVASWTRDRQHVAILESLSPQMQFPAGADLATLGEIGLRILGMSSSDAHRSAQNIDWRTTMLIPIPPNATSFKEITIKGSTGLLIEAAPRKPPTDGLPPLRNEILLWAADGVVFAAEGTVGPDELVEIAQTLQ